MQGIRRFLIIITTLLLVLGLAAYNSADDAKDEA